MERTMLVTGGARNTGYAIAQRFAREGYRVALTSRSAAQAGLTLETVLSDTLFKLAGELALEAISRKRAQ